MIGQDPGGMQAHVANPETEDQPVERAAAGGLDRGHQLASRAQPVTDRDQLAGGATGFLAGLHQSGELLGPQLVEVGDTADQFLVDQLLDENLADSQGSAAPTWEISVTAPDGYIASPIEQGSESKADSNDPADTNATTVRGETDTTIDPNDPTTEGNNAGYDYGYYAEPDVLIGDVTVTEGGDLSFEVNLSNPSAEDINVTFTTSDGTAVEGSDYNATTYTVFFPAGSTTGTVTVPTIQDTTDEPDETMTLSVQSTTGGPVGDTTDTGTGTILDDDDAPTISVSDAAEYEGTSLIFDINLSNPSTEDINFSVTLADGTAIVGTDTDTPVEYSTDGGATWTTLPAGDISFAPGETNIKVRVPSVVDGVYEGDETFDITATVSTGNTSNASDTGTGTIRDGDTPPDVILGDVTEWEGDNLVFDVNLSGPSTEDINITITTRDGSATAGDDYNTTTVTVTIPAGSTHTTITVPSIEDSIDENNETFEIYVDSHTGTLDDTSDTGTGTILDDDDTPTVVEVTSDSVEEGDVLEHNITLSEASGKDVSYPFSIENNSTQDSDYNATASDLVFSDGVTYDEATGMITVPAGVTTFSVRVPTNEDTVNEYDEFYDIKVGDASGTGTIEDDDGSLPVTLAYAYPKAYDNSLELDFATATEAGNIGFNVYAVSKKKLIRLNEELIPGAFDSFSPKTYRVSLALPPKSKVKRIIIASVDSNENEELHGPFDIGHKSGEEILSEAIDWERAKQQVEHMVKIQLPGVVLNGPDAADALAVAICHHHQVNLQGWQKV